MYMSEDGRLYGVVMQSGRGMNGLFVDLNACGLTGRVCKFPSGMIVLFFLMDE